MGRTRTDAEQQIAELLRTAKKSLGLSVAFLSRLDGTTQHLEVVESSLPLPFKDGATQVQSTSLCQAILDRELPTVIPDLKNFPAAMALPAARMPRIRSFVSVPVTLSDGTLYGTFCAAGLTSNKDLTERDTALMGVLASAASVVIEPQVQDQQRRSGIEQRLGPVVAGGGPVIALQPIVDLSTGAQVGVEALSRFPAEWEKTPDVVFAEAHSVGRGDALELMALRRAAEHLGGAEGYVAMNVSPGTLLTPECADLLAGLPVHRVLLELSEHEQVDDYDELAAALAPFRAAGLRLAIDDVGAGFSSLRHIVVTAPDVLKIDRSLVSGVHTDPVRTVLIRSMVDFARGLDAVVVAEGIETEQDAAALRALGVGYGQGWHFGRPTVPPVPAPRGDDRTTAAGIPTQRSDAVVPEWIGGAALA